MHKGIARLLLLFVFLMSASLALSAPEIFVEGLMPKAAVLKINGQRKMLRVGQTFLGVTLVSSEQASVLVEVEGETRRLELTQYIGSIYTPPEEAVVTIPRNEQLQYQTRAEINGRSTVVLVDTGANIVAMSESHARTLGIDYKGGEPSFIQTASGVAKARVVTLHSVDVGGIRVDNVKASVVEGSYPGTMLLGMSYLRHVKIAEENGILKLSRVR